MVFGPDNATPRRMANRKNRRSPEPVKQFKTPSYEAFWPSSSSLSGSVIHALVGHLGGSGLRWRNRAELVA